MTIASSDYNVLWAEAHRLRQDGRTFAASSLLITQWRARPSDLANTIATLEFLNECSVHEHALTVARNARTRWPTHAGIAASAGTITLALGLFDEATSHLRAAFDLDPLQGASLLRLAYCRRFETVDDVDVQRFAAAWNGNGGDPNARVCAGFAWGKALDDIGDFSHATLVLRAANALAQLGNRWTSHAWLRFVAERRNAQPLFNLSNGGDFVPIFIIGLPRTGTTLLAKALTQHSDVRDRGELEWIPAFYSLLEEQHLLRDTPALTQIAALIRAQMRRDDAPARFYIDKNPLNFRYLDFIIACFPNAKIIHCRRNARDTALSLWMQHFAHEDLGFSYDFSSIKEVQRGHHLLMEHWRRTLPIEILDIDYENFVADPRAQCKRLTNFLGIPLSGFQTGSAGTGIVTTASVWQVRQPIYKHSVDRWRNYASYLPELVETFAADLDG